MSRTLLVASVVVLAAACTRGKSLSHTDGAAPAVALPDAVPCDVAAVLTQHCVMCHGAMPKRGAPRTLIHASDFTQMRGDVTVGQYALMRVQNDALPMPPAPYPRLTPAEIATLAGWVNAGAQPSPAGCAVEDSSSQPAAMDAGPTSGPTTMTGTPSADAGPGTTQGGAGQPAVKPDAGTLLPDGGSVGPGTTGAANWSMFGHDLANTRTSPAEHALSADNVKGLKMLWQWKGAATTSTPAIVDGVVYLPAWDGKVHALSASDGKELWASDTLPNKVDSAPTVIDSSPAVTDSAIFVTDNNGGVHKLERASGKLLWSVPVDMDPQAHLWASPIYLPGSDSVLVGVASGEEQSAAPSQGYSFRGSVVALAAADGKEKWRFVTAEQASSGPGVSVWATPAVDLDRKTLYVGTGNNYAAPSSPHEDSLIALDTDTGMLRWGTQFTKDDLFTISAFGSGPDSDIGSSANLFDIDGKAAVGVGIKNGNYVALERETGMMLWTTMLTEGSVLGGVISASAYADGTIYVASNGSSDTTAFALDAKTGMHRWASMPEMGRTYGGLAYANGVVYWGTDAGEISALDAASGKTLWTANAPDSIAGSPSIANGTLFVPWGYQWTLLDNGTAGTGGLIAYGL